MASGLWKRAKEQSLVAQKLGQEQEINRAGSGSASLIFALALILHTVRNWKKVFIPTETLAIRARCWPKYSDLWGQEWRMTRAWRKISCYGESL